MEGIEGKVALLKCGANVGAGWRAQNSGLENIPIPP